MIQPAWRGDLHAYLGGIIRTADGIAESIGGVSDHVHLLIGLRATHRLADVIRELKAVSSGWAHNEIGRRGFAWQIARRDDCSRHGCLCRNNGINAAAALGFDERYL